MIAPRPRNAAATRQAILDSARAAFARSGYDGAGLREIAQGAGVTAMLVGRYFGSKEALFAEVAAATMAGPSLLGEADFAAPDFPEKFAAALIALTRGGAAPLDGFQIMLRSSSSPRAAEIGRDEIGRHHFATVAGALEGPLAPQRAAMLLALIAGFQVMRQMIGLPALAEASDEDLQAVLAPMIRGLVRG